MVKKIGLYILALVLPAIVFAQQPYVQLKISSQTVEERQPITVTIKTNVRGNIDIQLPDAFIRSGGVQSGMQSSVQFIKGKQQATTYHYRKFTGYIQEKGEYIFGPATVSGNKGDFKSKRQTVRVISRQNMLSSNPMANLDKPIFGLIEQSERVIYEGESVTILGRIYSQVHLIRVENYTPFQLEGPAASHALINPSKIKGSYQRIGGKNIRTYTIEKKVIFPEKVGEFTIQPFQTILVYNSPRSFFPQKQKIISNQIKIRVKSLPSGMPSCFINAVGNFDLSGKINKTNLKQGKVIELQLKISGHGNIQNIRNPTLKLPKGLTFYGDPEVYDSISFSTRGAEGSKTFTYYIQVNRAGTIQLQPVKIAFFNPVKEEYETLQCPFPQLHVKPGQNIAPPPNSLSPEGIPQEIMQPYLTDNSKNRNVLFFGWVGTLALFSPLMLGAVIGMLVRIKDKKEEKDAVNKRQLAHKTEVLKRLEALADHSNNTIAITSLSKDIIQFLALQFGVEKGVISREFIQQKASQHISAETKQLIIHVFDYLDQMKYGKNIGGADIKHLKQKVKEMIKAIAP